jgi:hypothetical protein
MVLRRPSSTRGWDSVSAHLDMMLPPRSPSKAALRMRRHRERRRDGLRCITVELRETEVTALIRKGLLRDDARNDRRAVRNAFYGFLDRTLDH